MSATNPAAALEALADLIADRVAERIAARTPAPVEAHSPYSVTDAGKRLGRSPKAIYKLVAEGRLKRVPGDRRVFVTHDSVERLLQGRG